MSRNDDSKQVGVMSGGENPGEGRVAKHEESAVAEAEPVRPARGERRKRQTREKLMRAAYHLMAERGVSSVAINEITEAADVGFGSFYNHFESKDAIHEAIVDEVLTRFGQALSRIDQQLEDPAEILGSSIRYVARRARAEPLWGRFLSRNAFSFHNLGSGMGQYLLRDLQRGIDSGRFRSHDFLMTLLSVGGAATAAISVEVELGSGHGPAKLIKQFDADTTNIAERVASSVLQTLGLAREEADEIARRPLPNMEIDRGFL
ncbi:MAG: AcrR family transcriptional regulator [Candidatus Binatia bacterium]